MNAHLRRGTARGGEAGFTLIEVLLATLLMTVILAALATVTAQWLPNWNRGMAHVQRAERLAIGLDRIVADLAVAETAPRRPMARAWRWCVNAQRSCRCRAMPRSVSKIRWC
jgi:prepilin-type N-terminal cleavage/methylation domain-containing protein